MFIYFIWDFKKMPIFYLTHRPDIATLTMNVHRGKSELSLSTSFSTFWTIISYEFSPSSKCGPDINTTEG